MELGWLPGALLGLGALGLVGAGIFRRSRLLILAGLAEIILLIGLIINYSTGVLLVVVGNVGLVAIAARLSRAPRVRGLRLLLRSDGKILKGTGLTEILGWPWGKAKGKKIETLIYADDRLAWKSALEEAAHKGEAVLEFRAINASGRLVWLHAFLEPVGGGMLLQAFDVTRYKLIEQALRNQERLLKGFSETAMVMLAANDDISWPFNKSIATMAMSLGAERAYLYKISAHEGTGHRSAVLQVQWARDNLRPHQDSPLAGELVEGDPRFSRWFRLLEHGQVIAGSVDSLPGEERLMLEAAGVGSILLLPLLIGGELWGFAGFEMAEVGRRFSPEIVKVLRAAAASLAAGVEKVGRIKELQLQRAILDRIYEHASDGILVVDSFLRPQFFNRRFLEVWGIDEEELKGTGDAHLSLLASRVNEPEDFAKVVLGLHENPTREMRFEIAIGKGGLLQIHSYPLAAAGPANGYVWFVSSASASGNSSLALGRNEKSEPPVSPSFDIACVLDERMRIRNINPGIEGVLGYKRSDLEGMPILRVVHSEDRQLVQKAIAAVRDAQRSQVRVKFRILRSGGASQWFEAEMKRPLTGSASRSVSMNAKGITRSKVGGARVGRAPSRRGPVELADRELLRREVQRLAGVDGAEAAFIYVKLENLDSIKNTLGREGEREAMRQIAQRLRSAIGGGVLGRLEVDGFGIVVGGVGEASSAKMVRRLAGLLREPFLFRGRAVRVSGSVGLALLPRDGKTFEQLLGSAAEVVGRGKRRIPSARVSFAGERAGFSGRSRLEGELRDALQSGSLTLYYQPVQDVVRGSVCGLEALVRWEHPVEGQILPEEFLPMIREQGLATTFDRQILVQALRQLANWQVNGGPLWVSVNLSDDSVRDPEFIDFLRGLLKSEGVDPRRLLIEVTEDAIVGDPDGARATFARLKETGVRLALDNFGRRGSSFGYLSSFPIDLIKIDRAFAGGAPFRSRDSGAVRAIIAQSKQMGAEVLAEGVENSAQLEWYKKSGVDYVQGFAISKAVLPSQISFG